MDGIDRGQIFTNAMFDQVGQLSRKLSSASSFKRAGSAPASQRSNHVSLLDGRGPHDQNQGNMFAAGGQAAIAEDRQMLDPRWLEDQRIPDGAARNLGDLAKHSLVSNQRQLGEHVLGDEQRNGATYDFQARQMMFDLQVENDIKNDSFQKQTNNKWQHQHDFSDFYENNSDTLNLNERTGEEELLGEVGASQQRDWPPKHEEAFQLCDGPSGVFDRQGFPGEAQGAEEMIDFYEQERINSFENTYN